VIIAPDVILTAAHCFAGSNKSSLRVEFSTKFIPPALGSSGDDANTVSFRRKINRLIVHNGFSEDAAVGGNVAASNDLAIFSFDGPLPTGYLAALLNVDDKTLPPTLDLAGYGMTEDNSPQTTGTLKTVTAQIQEIDAYRKVIVTQNSETNPSGAMRGDSGGPAFARRDTALELAGILSTGTSVAGRYSGKNTYTSVAQHVKWIFDNISKIRNPNIRVEPVAGISALADRLNDNLYSILILNKENQSHWCSFQISGFIIMPNMERSANLVLQQTADPAGGQDATTTLARNIPAAENGINGSTTFFAQRPILGRPVGNISIVSQCDDAPPSLAQKVLLSDVLNRELEN
jgi:hypothetical protein